jgi:hypothetical protein
MSEQQESRLTTSEEQQQPKEHCGHECVCISVPGIERSRKEPCDTSSGTRYKCPHDTRSRPHPTPAPCPHWKDARNLKSDFRDQIKGDHYCNLEAPCPQHQIWQHCPVAGEIARKAREEIFSTLDKWFKEHDCWKSEHGNYWTPVPFPASSLMQLIDSLRTTTHTEQEQPR